jgi:hypothetical protein
MCQGEYFFSLLSTFECLAQLRFETGLSSTIGNFNWVVSAYLKEVEIEKLQNEYILRFIVEHDVKISGVFLRYSNKHEYRETVALRG